MLIVSTSVQVYWASFCLLAAMFCLMAISFSSSCGLCALDITPEKRTTAAKPAATRQLFIDLLIMLPRSRSNRFVFESRAREQTIQKLPKTGHHAGTLTITRRYVPE